LVRLFWFLVGNVILIISAFRIFQHRGGFLSPWDAVFWGTVILLLAVRHFDITRLHGQTFAGTPASLAHWRRYALVLLVLSAAAWAASHLWAFLRA
jgi:hypothetical protein